MSIFEPDKPDAPFATALEAAEAVFDAMACSVQQLLEEASYEEAAMVAERMADVEAHIKRLRGAP